MSERPPGALLCRLLVLALVVLAWDGIVPRFGYPALRAAGSWSCAEHVDRRRWAALALAVGDARYNVRGLRVGRGWRHCSRGPVQPVAGDRILVLSLRGDPAGDAGGRHRAAAADLSAAAFGGAGLRLDRGVLPGARQHDAGTELCRPQSHRAVRTLQGVALADAVAAQVAVGAAANARRPAYRRRPVADRRSGGRNRRGLRRCRLGARLSHRRVRLPSQHPAHVRRAAAAVARRRGDLLRAVGGLASVLRRWHESAVKREH